MSDLTLEEREAANHALGDWQETCQQAHAVVADPVDFRAGFAAGLAFAERQVDPQAAEPHVLAMEQSAGRPGEWVQCSCGWASPDVQFPTPDEAIEWARTQHLAAQSSPSERQVDPQGDGSMKATVASDDAIDISTRAHQIDAPEGYSRECYDEFAIVVQEVADALAPDVGAVVSGQYEPPAYWIRVAAAQSSPSEPTPEQVEQAAKALWMLETSAPGSSWDALDLDSKPTYRKKAEAALAAARVDPSTESQEQK